VLAPNVVPNGLQHPLLGKRCRADRERIRPGGRERLDLRRARDAAGHEQIARRPAPRRAHQLDRIRLGRAVREQIGKLIHIPNMV